ncbi:MAG: glutamate racemase [Clostridia bacterium]
MKIGIFDSGLGGLNIFIEILKVFNSQYIYLADNMHTPYATKNVEDVKKYIDRYIEILVKAGCKVIVIACNSATALMISSLRKKYKDVCIIGTEPAIKKAIDESDITKKIIVCTTSITAKTEKVHNLILKLKAKNRVQLLPLDNLVTYLENESTDEKIVKKYLIKKFEKFDFQNYSCIVLGCTHFPLYIKIFREIIDSRINIIDGSIGVANNFKKQVELLNIPNDKNTNIVFLLTKNSLIFKEKVKKILKDVNVQIEFKSVNE